eukprot:356348-Chlamydomonas_euryale.AAC.24
MPGPWQHDVAWYDHVAWHSLSCHVLPCHANFMPLLEPSMSCTSAPPAILGQACTQSSLQAVL